MDTAVLPVIVLGVAPESLKNTYLALLGMGGLLVAAVVQPVVGRFSDRTRSPLGRRVPYIGFGTAAVCGSLALVAVAPNFGALFASWMFIQANLNVAYGPGMALIRDLVPGSRVGTAASLKILLDAAGGLAMITASAAIIGRAAGPGGLLPGGEYVDWEWLTLAMLGAVLAVSVVVTCVTTLRREAASGRRRRVAAGAGGPVVDGQLALFLVSRLLLMTAVYSFPTYGLFFLRDVVEADNPAQMLSSMIPAIGGSLAVSVWVSGRVSDRVGRKPVVIAGAAGAAVSTLWLLTVEGTLGVVATACVIGASAGALLSAGWAMANELGDEQRAGAHIGIVNLSTIGGAALPRVFGPGIDLLNQWGDDWGYRTLIAGCAALFVAGAVTVLPVRAPRGEGDLESGGGLPPP